MNSSSRRTAGFLLIFMRYFVERIVKFGGMSRATEILMDDIKLFSCQTMTRESDKACAWRPHCRGIIPPEVVLQSAEVM